MVISIIYLIISFLFDNFMSNIFPSTLGNVSYFTTIYVIISLVIIYPYYGNEKKYYILAIIFGLLFRIIGVILAVPTLIIIIEVLKYKNIVKRM